MNKIFFSSCYGDTLGKAEELGFVDEYPSGLKEGEWTPELADGLEEEAKEHIEKKGYIFADLDNVKEEFAEFLKDCLENHPLSEEPKWILRGKLSEAHRNGESERAKEELRILIEYERDHWNP